MESKGLYIHIPFCVQKCKYCDFTSYVADGNEKDKYLDSLEKELKMYKLNQEEISTIFIGGGTPTILNKIQLKRLFKMIEDNVDLKKVEEYSIEANPGTLSIEKLKIMKDAGVNRLSIGLQAVQDKHLLFMGRIHNLKQFEESFYNARKVGFDNINIDVIFAFDTQSLEDWKETIDYVAEIKPEHISAYSLIIEEGTDFFEMYKKGELKDIDEEKYLDMYRYTVEKLKKYGFYQYEISNFCNVGYECKHNIKYWNCDEYFGVGVGASGYINNERYTNVKTLNDYSKATDSNVFPIKSKEVLDFKEHFNEKIMLGLRMNSGINLSLIDKINNQELEKCIIKSIENYQKKGYIEKCKDNTIKLTQSGREISNSIIVDLML
ncbi:radical SAM family heme chaperone HemW [Peptostreptococcus russellii]|uniref:radical SAM family heme chaperone HemW n=1 Tax=Peptostreptococcus russellii TaxID=215200 RepID=UPI003F5888D3